MGGYCNLTTVPSAPLLARLLESPLRARLLLLRRRCESLPRAAFGGVCGVLKGRWVTVGAFDRLSHFAIPVNHRAVFSQRGHVVVVESDNSDERGLFFAPKLFRTGPSRLPYTSLSPWRSRRCRWPGCRLRWRSCSRRPSPSRPQALRARCLQVGIR